MDIPKENMRSGSEWISPYEAARLMGGAVSRVTLHRWAVEGKITAIRLPNGWWRISREAIEQLLTPVAPEAEEPHPDQWSLLDDDAVVEREAC